MMSGWPSELRVSKDKRTITIVFDDGVSYTHSAEYLRVVSPSAEVQGHSPSQRKTVWGKRDVEIMKLDPIGNYAVRITFTDLHDTGIFSWAYLRELGEEYEERWNSYLDELDDKGYDR
ncbi:MAG: DUF971 domain-containing protein [Hyphomicrobiales bacterium]